jgi:hypothetical protein
MIYINNQVYILNYPRQFYSQNSSATFRGLHKLVLFQMPHKEKLSI